MSILDHVGFTGKKSKKIDRPVIGEFVTTFGVFVTVELPSVRDMLSVAQASTDMMSMALLIHNTCKFDGKSLDSDELLNLPMSAFSEVIQGFNTQVANFEADKKRRQEVCSAYFN